MQALCLVSVTLWSWTQHNMTSLFRKDKILINSRPLDKGPQGNCVYLLRTSWCSTKNDFHVLHSWQSTSGRKSNANQSSSHICRDQRRRNHSLWLLFGVSCGCIWLQQAKLGRYMQCAHVARPWHQQTIMKTHTKTRQHTPSSHTNSPWQTGGGPSICSLSPSRHVRISLPTKVKPGRHEYLIMSPVR